MKQSGPNLTISCIDIGGRGVPDEALRPIAELVNWLVVEPDPEESRRLTDGGTSGWGGLRVIEAAIGSQDTADENSGTRELHLYRQRGCSSLLKADAARTSIYDRQHYYILDDTIPGSVRPRDELFVLED